MLLVVAFFGILLFAFCVVAFALRPTTEQKAVDKRLDIIKHSGEEVEFSGNEFDQLLKAASTGSFGWLEEILQGFSFSQKIQVLVLQANSKTTVGTLMVTSLGLAAVAFVAAYLFTPFLPVAVIAAAMAFFVPLGLLRFRRNRRITAFNTALPDAVDMMARSLRAGHAVVAAISIVAEHAAEPASSEFGEVFRKQSFGLPLRDALIQMLERVPSQDLRVVVTGILVQKDTGGNLAEILDRTAHVIRERIRIQGEIRTHTAQGRMTGWILCLLPVVMMFLINIINPGYSKVLISDPFGRKLLYVGMALLALGGFLIRKIVNGIEV